MEIKDIDYYIDNIGDMVEPFYFIEGVVVDSHTGYTIATWDDKAIVINPALADTLEYQDLARLIVAIADNLAYQLKEEIDTDDGLYLAVSVDLINMLYKLGRIDAERHKEYLDVMGVKT